MLSFRTPLSRIAAALVMAFALVLPLHAQQTLPPGAELPQANEAFPSATGGTSSLSSLAGEQGLAVVFWSNNCKWTDSYVDRLKVLDSEFASKGVSFVLVNSNAASAFPKESVEGMSAFLDETGLDIAYLKDAQGALAQALGASRTPEVFLFDANSALVYVGGIDNSPGDPANVSAPFLRKALEALLAGEAIDQAQTPGLGCRINLP